MLRHTIEVAGARFLIRESAGIEQAKDDVISAVRAGGGVVNLAVVGTSSVAVLISPGDAVIFRSDEVESDEYESESDEEGGQGNGPDSSEPFNPFSSLEPFDSLT